jgi:hypothetical protein
MARKLRMRAPGNEQQKNNDAGNTRHKRLHLMAVSLSAGTEAHTAQFLPQVEVRSRTAACFAAAIGPRKAEPRRRNYIELILFQAKEPQPPCFISNSPSSPS